MSHSVDNTLRIVELVNEMLDPDEPLGPDTRLDDLDVTSMQLTDLVMALEDEFGVRIKGEELGSETRLRELLSHTA